MRGFDFVLPHRHQQIVETVRRAGRHGISTDRLFDAIYGDDMDGGPSSGTKVLHVHISRLNKTLERHGWWIGGENTGTRHAYGRYTLMRIDQEVSDAAE